MDTQTLRAAILAIVDRALLDQNTADYHDRPQDSPEPSVVTDRIMALIDHKPEGN